MKRMLNAVRQQRRTPWLLLVKSLIAMSAAWLIAGLVMPGIIPFFAAAAALLVVQPSVHQSFGRAVERTIGVLFGVIVASAFLMAFGRQAWVYFAAIALTAIAAWLMQATYGTSSQAVMSAIIVLALGKPDGHYAVERVIETLIGAILGTVVNALIVPPVHSEPGRRALARLGSELANALTRLAQAVERPHTRAELLDLLLKARLLMPMRDAVGPAIASGEESLTLNPRQSKHRAVIAEQRALLDLLSPTVIQTVGMSRALCDLYSDSLRAEPLAPAIAEQLRRAAHDVRLAVHLAEVESAPPTVAIPALTSPISVPLPPASENWVLIGFLLEDLRRIHEQYTAQT